MYCNSPYNYAKMQSKKMPGNDMTVGMNQPMMQAMPQSTAFTPQMPPYPYAQPVMVPSFQQPVLMQESFTEVATPLPPGAAPIDFDQLLETPVYDVEYTQGYLKTQIGRKVKVEFLIGTNMFIDREGTLMDVGISYIIIQETETDDLLLCDIYSIKFVKFFY